jgi:hypothetical protein
MSNASTPSSASDIVIAPAHECEAAQPGFRSPKAECRLSTDTDVFSAATVCDISPDGISLIVGRRFGPGALLTIRMFSLSGSGVIIKRAKVRQARQVGDAEWAHDCAFLLRNLREREWGMLFGEASGA